MLGRIICVAILAATLAAQEKTPSAPSAPTFQIGGLLIDAVTSQPVHQARVGIASVSKRDAYTTIITGDDGRFSFGNLAPGKYTLTAERRGYLTQSFNQHGQFSSAIVVGPDLDSGNLVFSLAPESIVSGRVSDEAGEPVRDAEVQLFQWATEGDPGHLRQNRQTDDDGFYQFSSLSPGKYLLVVNARVWYAQRPRRQAKALAGAVQDGAAEDRLVTSPSLSLDASDGYPADGPQSLLDVAYPLTFYPGVTDAAAASPIVLKSGDRFVADLALQPVPALHLRVPSSGGNLVLQSRLPDGSLIRIPFDQRGTASGDIQIAGIAPGPYVAQIYEGRVGRDGNYVRGAMSVSLLQASGSGAASLEKETPKVAITAAVQSDASAPSSLSGSLSGYLQLYNRKNQESVGVQIKGPGDLEFAQDIEPGNFEVSLTSNSGAYIKALSATGATVNGRILEVKGSAPVKLNLIVAYGEVQVTGVALKDGKPSPGAMIVLVPQDAAHNRVLFRRDQSDTDGSFTLRSVPPGKYTVLALEEAQAWDLEWWNPQVLKPYLSGAETIQVEPGGKYDLKVKTQ